MLLNSLPNDKILDWSKLKALADDKINVTYKLKFVSERLENILTYKLKFVSERLENILEKVENVGYQLNSKSFGALSTKQQNFDSACIPI